jgi:hypothetical protein
MTQNPSFQVRKRAVMPNYPESDQHEHNQDPLTAVGDISDPGYKRVGQLEKEDIIILVLSAILVVATFWLATRIL